IWDFAGQAVFQDLWSFYFQGTDIIFLITDSSFRNVMQTKTLLRTIRKEAPAVPLFIIANKQDLPESMKGDKIKRLLGAPTFSMVATDKTRRDEFIRFMLEVAAKTVGVQLPDRPITEMITVRRKTEDIEEVRDRQRDIAEAGFEDVPFESAQDQLSKIESDLGIKETETTTKTDVAEVGDESLTEATQKLVATPVSAAPKLLDLLLIVQKEGLSEPAYHLNYSGENIDVNSVVSLISALDSFAGIDGEPGGIATKTDALETIEHEGNLVIVEKSDHFVFALVISNDSEEEKQRKMMTQLLMTIEQKYRDTWESWDGSVQIFEESVFEVLTQFPLRPVSFDYVVRSREAGRPLPFASREVGKAVVEVKTAIDASSTVGGLVRALDLPRETIIGCLQIMEKFGWVDFKVEIGPESHLKKKGPVDEETHKAYGDVVIRFVDLCDGGTALEDVVRKLNVSLPAMKFVATKLVLDGVLEVIA
ncbi:MAG: ADP-ribosylation factor-like protein, partial [Candidatus Thorarchaeota archaeon]